MIFVDTGALYALVGQKDVHHEEAREFYGQVIDKIPLVLSAPVMTEIWYLLQMRVHVEAAEKVWHAVCQGTFALLDLELGDVIEALEIQKKYRDANFGLTDATSMALCERHQIDRVFTYDRKDFSLFRPSFTRRLKLVPEE